MINKKTLKYYKKLDEEINSKNIKSLKSKERTIVSLTSDAPFKAFFINNPDFMKEFLILELGLDLNPDDVDIEVDSEEFPIENDNGRTYRVDILVYLNDDMIANVEANSERYNDIMWRNLVYIAKLTSTKLLKKSDDTSKLKSKKLFQLNINANEYDDAFGEDTLELKGKHINAKNFLIKLKNVAYYRKLYYNGDKLNKADLWIVALSSKTYSELYRILCDIYDDDNHIDEIMKEVWKLNQDKKILSDWEAEMLEEMVKHTSLENAKNEGLEQGVNQEKLETARKMLEENIDTELISKITGLSRKQIEDLTKNI